MSPIETRRVTHREHEQTSQLLQIPGHSSFSPLCPLCCASITGAEQDGVIERCAAGEGIAQLWLSLQVCLPRAPVPSFQRRGGRTLGRTLPGSFTQRVNNALFFSLPRYPSMISVERDLPGHSGTRPFMLLSYFDSVSTSQRGICWYPLY